MHEKTSYVFILYFTLSELRLLDLGLEIRYNPSSTDVRRQDKQTYYEQFYMAQHNENIQIQ